MSDPLERDDVAAAIFAAQVKQGLSYVDEQTTNRPLQTPPAARLDPKSLLRTPAQAIPNPSPVSPLAPPELKDILIPLPKDSKVVPPNAKTMAPPNPQQLELDLPRTEIKKPSSAPEWFEYLDKRIDGLKFDILNLTHRVVELKQVVLAKKQRKSVSTQGT